MVPMTHFIQGACFGYYDQKFEQCVNCKYNKSCNNATNSKEVNSIRKVFKYKSRIIKQFVQKYSQK